eukprot:1161487-Pelagomonas_calceolata.AAC.3
MPRTSAKFVLLCSNQSIFATVLTGLPVPGGSGERAGQYVSQDKTACSRRKWGACRAIRLSG